MLDSCRITKKIQTISTGTTSTTTGPDDDGLHQQRHTVRVMYKYSSKELVQMIVSTDLTNSTSLQEMFLPKNSPTTDAIIANAGNNKLLIPNHILGMATDWLCVLKKIRWFVTELSIVQQEQERNWYKQLPEFEQSMYTSNITLLVEQQQLLLRQLQQVTSVSSSSASSNAAFGSSSSLAKKRKTATTNADTDNADMDHMMDANGSSKKRKPRKIIPVIKEYVEVTENDVLFGRGGRSNHHSGNKVYRDIVTDHQEKYQKCTSKSEKTKVAQSIVDYVNDTIGGRFLELDKNIVDQSKYNKNKELEEKLQGQEQGKTKKEGANTDTITTSDSKEQEQQQLSWYLVPNVVARTKVGQALRENNTQEARAAKRAKYTTPTKSTTTTTETTKVELEASEMAATDGIAADTTVPTTTVADNEEEEQDDGTVNSDSTSGGAEEYV